MGRRQKWITLSLNILFYGLCGVLACIILYPHTSLSFRDKFYYPVFRGLNAEDIVIIKGKSDKLYVEGINKRVSYSSSNFRVAEVQINGKVYGHKVGTAFITAKVNKKSCKCRVRVIDINKKKLTIHVGEEKTLKISGIRSGIKWGTSKKSVAKVSARGEVIGISEGTAVITGKVKGKKLECQVTVLP